MDQGKVEIISIVGMCKKFKVSHMTIYRHYLPKLKPVKKIGRKQYYLWEEVKEVHDKLVSAIDKYKIIG